VLVVPEKNTCGTHVHFTSVKNFFPKLCIGSSSKNFSPQNHIILQQISYNKLSNILKLSTSACVGPIFLFFNMCGPIQSIFDLLPAISFPFSILSASESSDAWQDQRLTQQAWPSVGRCGELSRASSGKQPAGAAADTDVHIPSNPITPTHQVTSAR
jgi:hypothetical protein